MDVDENMEAEQRGSRSTITGKRRRNVSIVKSESPEGLPPPPAKTARRESPAESDDSEFVLPSNEHPSTDDSLSEEDNVDQSAGEDGMEENIPMDGELDNPPTLAGEEVDVESGVQSLSLAPDNQPPSVLANDNNNGNGILALPDMGYAVVEAGAAPSKEPQKFPGTMPPTTISLTSRATGMSGEARIQSSRVDVDFPVQHLHTLPRSIIRAEPPTGK